MVCDKCSSKVRKHDKRIAGWLCIIIGVYSGLKLSPTLSFKFAGSLYLWFILFIVPGVLLVISKPRYNYWCSKCKRMVSVKES